MCFFEDYITKNEKYKIYAPQMQKDQIQNSTFSTLVLKKINHGEIRESFFPCLYYDRM